MPEVFDKCRSGGGKIRTKRLNVKEYVHFCIPKGGGSSVRGEIKSYKKVLKGNYGK